MCEADLVCRRLAPAWKLVTIVLNHALSFDCCVVPPEALASYAEELYEIVDALMFAGQDRLEHVFHQKNAFAQARWRFRRHTEVTDGLPAQYLAGVSSVAKSTWSQAIKTLGLVEAARDAQDKWRRMGLTMDERARPRWTDAPAKELDVARVGARPLRKRQTSWNQPLAEAAKRCEPLKSHTACLTQMGGDETRCGSP